MGFAYFDSCFVGDGTLIHWEGYNHADILSISSLRWVSRWSWSFWVSWIHFDTSSSYGWLTQSRHPDAWELYYPGCAHVRLVMVFLLVLSCDGLCHQRRCLKCRKEWVWPKFSNTVYIYSFCKSLWLHSAHILKLFLITNIAKNQAYVWWENTQEKSWSGQKLTGWKMN